MIAIADQIIALSFLVLIFYKKVEIIVFYPERNKIVFEKDTMKVSYISDFMFDFFSDFMLYL